MCEIDGFVIVDGIGNVVFVPFIEASTQNVSKTKEIHALPYRVIKALSRISHAFP